MSSALPPAPVWPAHLYPHWYIACRSQDLGARRPLACEIMNQPLVLFRDGQGKAAALLDRCAHRNVPLSAGWLKQGELQCRYHGWRFNPEGRCSAIPGLCSGSSDQPARRVPAFAVREQQGFVWVYAAANIAPDHEPLTFPESDNPRYQQLNWSFSGPSTVEDVAENFLDGTHTHFVHPGLLRNDGRRRQITARVTRAADRAEAYYPNDQTLDGWLYRILTGGLKEINVSARFIMPSVMQQEYTSNRPDYHFYYTVGLTPHNAHSITGHVRMSFCAGRWTPLFKLVSGPMFRIGIAQDLGILRLHSAHLQRFERPQYAYSELDLLRPHIDALRQGQPYQPFAREVTLNL